MRFQKGQSGNPGGRAKNPKVAKLRALIDAEALIQQLSLAAANGDTAAAKLLLDRAIPVLKPTDEAIKFASDSDDPAALAALVIRDMATGKLTPLQAQTVLNGLASHCRIIEATELEQRIAALEAAQ